MHLNVCLIAVVTGLAPGLTAEMLRYYGKAKFDSATYIGIPTITYSVISEIYK